MSIEKDNLVSEGRYLEAENIKNKINELKMNMTGMKKKDLNFQQSQEMQNLEDNFNQELSHLDEKWESFFLNFNDRVKKIDDANSIRHRAEMEDLHALLDMKLPKQPKFSKEYLILKQSEFNLVKQERYFYYFILDILRLIKLKQNVMKWRELRQTNILKKETKNLKLKLIS